MENKKRTLEYLHIPRSTFYYDSILSIKDENLKKEIEQVLVDHPSYGHKRISIELGINKKRVRRVMRKFGIKPSRKRKTPSRQGKKGDPASPNLLVFLFPLYQNHVWITDFTYLRWRNRWVYVCTVIDLFSREVVGISIRTNHSAMLVAEALLNAILDNPLPLIIHSDQGSEYKSKLFRMILTDHKIL